jgi:TPP-dependent pyruvate/acetoin dehydrogenase alpha subunit
VNVKKWLTRAENDKLIAEVDAQLETDRDFAVSSPMPEPESAVGRPYCDPSCHQIKPRYATPKVKVGKVSTSRHTEAAVHLK